eukprot:CAMPEP_0114273722 /NCGR_PEP_ID=MMETSP0058-20121206/29288_1 /TAXON_ID=36894 /ORGANISM="Pyramimonas parkeae, CCMP726" /LENGTH=316 /DNA_ID=CAMNT_0001393275 /DNA_START=118 /DNA_END=1068 /DNA_ORIENTATION=+
MSILERVNVLENFGLPSGMAEAVEKEDRQVGMRIFIVDNSTSTLNAQTKVPCRFFVLNPSQAAQESNWQNLKAGTDYCEINTLNGTMQEQVHVLKNMLDTTKLRAGTPLGKCIEAVGRLLQADLDTMIEEQKLAYLVLVTDGVPSDESDSSFMHTESLMVKGLRKLCAEYPLFVVIRLCTSNQRVANYFNKLDQEVEFALDVLCNLEAEARQVKAVNPWLTYFPELHAIREGGTNLRLLDLLDERPFTGDEIRKFMQMFMFRTSDPPIPDWRNAAQFTQALANLNEKMSKFYDPTDRTMKLMIDVSEVHKVLTAYL